MIRKVKCPACGKMMVQDSNGGVCCEGLAEMKLKNRRERLEKLLKLDMPQVIIDKERELIARAEVELRIAKGN
jgi:hypothetical protein